MTEKKHNIHFIQNFKNIVTDTNNILKLGQFIKF